MKISAHYPMLLFFPLIASLSYYHITDIIQPRLNPRGMRNDGL